ncbi:Kinesin-like protein kip2 [Binucleata daphniae]
MKTNKKIDVYVRIRDSTTNNSLWHVSDNVLYQRINNTTQLTYSSYQSVFYQVTTEFIYQSCIKEVINDLMSNRNCTIFAYGQTGSGKTYTMLGTKTDPGIIKLSLKEILEKNCNVSVSYIEIYNETVIDLINKDNNIRLLSSVKNSHVNDVSKVEIKNLEQALQIIDKCEKIRKVGKTELNDRSSRSHTIFQIHIENNKKTNILSLIDLAGSERAGGNLERRKEGSYINKSLLALGSVVNALIKNEFVSYRDSKLTKILQHSLDGHSNVISLCMISPDENCRSESISTLNFAARLSKIEMKDRNTRLVTIAGGEEICTGCKCCKKNAIKTLKSEKIKFKDITLIESNILDKKEQLNKEYETKIAMYIAENELYLERIKNLEDTVKSLMLQAPSKRISDLFELEKNMFHLQLEIIKRKKNVADLENISNL